MAKTQETSRKRTPKCYMPAKKYRNLKNYFEECTGNSSLHGVRYLGEQGRTVVEKIVWLVIIVISMTFCILFVHQTYKKWETTPILVTVGTTQMPIQHITFPGVTICPAKKVSRNLVDVLDRFRQEENWTMQEKLDFKHTQMWCQYNNYSAFRSTFDLQETYSIDTLDFIHNNTPPMKDIFWSCEWSGIPKPCDEIFTKTFTEEGVCYTFNGLDRSDMFEMSVLKYEDFNTADSTSCYENYQRECQSSYPRRPTPGAEAGLQVFLIVDEDDLNPCMDVRKGHKVMIHKPHESPSTKYNFFYVPLGGSVTVALNPQLITTDDTLRSYAVEQRKCYYGDEKNLTHFKYYSQTNCQTECYLYATKLFENCSDFYMPHIHSNTKICNASNSLSMRKNSHHMMNYLTNLTLNMPDLIRDSLSAFQIPPEAAEVCHCLPSCKSLKYNAEIIQTDYDAYDKKDEDRDKENVQYSKLSIYFKEGQFIPYERKEMFGLMDFVAYCGGLLGLFIGFSFIALIEVVYFVCFRPVCNIFLYGRKFWSGVEKAPQKEDDGNVLKDLDESN